ncbi:MAG: 2-oxoacid:acceptor oxidoreductase family protein [Candidatus Hermodarchaeia archaeon]|jgi:2-oxoacid:acceptor oxidoreductase gamma subunit (pyruvate/2-ketoisovalerate family)
MNLFEIRFHGRGGQGSVTGAKILGDATRMEKKHFQAFAHYGAERRGAPVMAFTRIADETIRLHSYIYEPEAVVILDETLIDNPTVQKGVKNGTFMIINSPRQPQDFTPEMKVKISTVDATKIALDEGILVAGIAVVNTIMLGAVARATGIVTIESVKKAIRKGLSGLPDKVIETNVEAAQRAYDELKMGYSL